MANNTVEATLRSKFEDGVGRGIERTQRTIEQAMGNIKSAGGTAAAGFNAAWSSVTGGLEDYGRQLHIAGEQSEGTFKGISLAAAAMAIAVTVAALKAGRALVDFLAELVKESSAALEAKLAFEALTKAQGDNADVVLGKLKRATDGQVSGTKLMQDANRVMQSGVAISMEMYGKLAENVFRLAKASGVDGAQAMDVLTNAVIRGNARGLQSIGLHLAVKDAVTAMAEASGASASKLGDASKMQAFYNELLEKSGDAVGALGPAILTVEDILRQTQNTWSGFLSSLGQAIGRSGTLEELLRKTSAALLDTKAGKTQLDELTLATNRFVMSALKGFQGFAAVMSSTLEVANVFWGTLKVMFATGSAAVLAAVGGVTMVIEWMSAAMDTLTPGDKALHGAYEKIKSINRTIKGAIEENAQDIKNAYSGVLPEVAKKLDEMAVGAAKLAGELSGTTEEILRGAGGMKAHAEAAGLDAEAQKKLNEQMQKYRELRASLLGGEGNSRAAALQELFNTTVKIDQEITLKGIEWDRRRDELKILALKAYDATLAEIDTKERERQARIDDEVMRDQSEVFRTWQKQQAEKALLEGAAVERQIDAERRFQEIMAEAAKKREEQRRREVAEAVGMASVIERTIAMSTSGKLSANAGLEALKQMPQTVTLLQKKLDELRSKPILTEEQVEEVVKLQNAIERLNRINWTPWKKALDGMRQELRQFSQQATEAWANFFSALVQHQDGAGKKLLGAFIGMIGQMLVHIGVILIQSGIAEIALAQTLVGRLMGASVAGGIKALAVGALLAAAGGVMEGAAANLSQSSGAGSGAGAGSSVQQASSSGQTAVQVINVGAPGRAQNAGDAGMTSQEIHLKLSLEPGIVVKHVTRELKGNNKEFRLVVSNA